VGRPIDRLETSDDVRRFIDAPRPSFIVMLRSEYDALPPDISLEVLTNQPAVSATTGRGFRRQVWNQLVIVRASPLITHTGGIVAGNARLQ
jgi:hypothetical protein